MLSIIASFLPPCEGVERALKGELTTPRDWERAMKSARKAGEIHLLIVRAASKMARVERLRAKIPAIRAKALSDLKSELADPETPESWKGRIAERIRAVERGAGASGTEREIAKLIINTEELASLAAKMTARWVAVDGAKKGGEEGATKARAAFEAALKQEFYGHPDP